MTAPSPQAAEAAGEIARGLGAANNEELQAEFAEIIDRAFAARIEAADKMEAELECATAAFHNLAADFEQGKRFGSQVPVNLRAAAKSYKTALKNYAAAKAKPERI